MEARAVLKAQIDVLADNLRQAAKALQSPKIDLSLLERVSVRFDKLIKKQHASLDNLREEIEKGLPLDACWDSFRIIRKGCDPLFRECLAFVQGSLVRTAVLDNGLCHIADALLDELSKRTGISWQRFTLLSEQEFFADMAEIIRLRFPAISVWNLPIAAHEFGHFIGPKIEVPVQRGNPRYPFQAILEREKKKDSKSWSLMHEHFADIFATYTLGPAFACACILLRFDPRRAYEEGETHPADAKRAYLISKTLEKMDEAEGGIEPPYQAINEWLGKLWRRGLSAAKKPESLDQAVILPMDELLDELYSLMDSEIPAARYKGWLRAQGLSEELRPDKNGEPALNIADTLPDVLNAAWLCRINHGDGDKFSLREISDKAVALCHQIATKK
jgi:hypothetical protein